MGLSGKGCMVLGCVSLILIISTLPFMGLSLVSVGGSQIKTSIGALFVPSIMRNPAGHTLSNSTTMFFVLLLRDDAFQIGVYFENITLRFFYVETNTTFIPIAAHTLPGFYQKGNDDGSTTDHFDSVRTYGISWEEVSNNVSDVVLKVDLSTAVTFEYSDWKSKRHQLLMHGDVKVSTTTGNLVAQEGVRASPMLIVKWL